VIVKLKAIVAIDVAAIFGVKVAEDRPERVWMDSGSEVRDYPAAQSPKAVKALVVQAREHNLPPNFLLRSGEAVICSGGSPAPANITDFGAQFAFRRTP